MRHLDESLPSMESRPELTVVQIDGVSRSFGDVQAVSNLNLQIRRGEIYGLIGPDGAGKTTTMRLLAGALEADHGSIRVAGLDVKKDPDRLHECIGYMPQLYGLYADLTVYENLLFFGRLFGVERFRMMDRIKSLLGFVRLSEFSQRRAGDLSGGMYKKLAIACSILHEPDLLLLDEPTNGVDPVSRRDLWALLFSLSAGGVTVLVSTPYMDEAERCHRVGLIYNGSLAREGDPASLLEELDHRVYLYRTDRPAAELHRVRSSLTESALCTVSSEGVRLLFTEKRKRQQGKKGMSFEAVQPGMEDLLMLIQHQREGTA